MHSSARPKIFTRSGLVLNWFQCRRELCTYAGKVLIEIILLERMCQGKGALGAVNEKMRLNWMSVGFGMASIDLYIGNNNRISG
jgi:hypothetical protein